MAGLQLHDKINPRTATIGHSIWDSIPEDNFRERLVILEERTNAIPIRPQSFAIPTCSRRSLAEARLLSVDAEQKLADDFAYIASVGEGAQSVSAVCIEEYLEPKRLCVRLAAVDTVNSQLQYALQEVGQILQQLATKSNQEVSQGTAHTLLELIVKQHWQKLFGRLRSKKWQKPKYLSRTHKKTLWQDLELLIHRVQHIYPKRRDPRRIECELQLREFSTLIQDFEDVTLGSNSEFSYMLNIVISSYDLCQVSALKGFAAELDKIGSPTPQIAAAIKTFRQIEKIGSYQRIAQDLIKIARQCPSLFRDVTFEYIPTYASVATDIGYEDWAKTLHVHAEVQLVVYYDLLSIQKSKGLSADTMQFHPSRVIGTSKYLCYLCYLFLKFHGQFIPVNTHGRLYDQWTIPDLVDFDDRIVFKYRKVIEEIDQIVITMSDEVGQRCGKRDTWRVEPMTSRQNLLNPTTMALHDHLCDCNVHDVHYTDRASFHEDLDMLKLTDKS